MLRSAIVSLAAAAAIAAPAFAIAAPVGPVGAIHIDIAPKLASKTKEFSERDFDTLRTDLRRAIERELTRKGALTPSGGTLDLVIEDAKSTRPTFRQMTEKPGLSYESFGLGGAAIKGAYRGPDGAVQPIDFTWYETDLRFARSGWTWQGASDAFNRFAMKLARS